MPEPAAVPRYLRIAAVGLVVFSSVLAAAAFYCQPKPERHTVSASTLVLGAGQSIPVAPAGEPVYISAEAEFTAPHKATDVVVLFESWRGNQGFGLYQSSASVTYASAGIYDGKRGFGRVRLECPGVKQAARRRVALTLDGNSAVFALDGVPCASADGLQLAPSLERVSTGVLAGGKLHSAVVSFRTERTTIRAVLLNKILRVVSLLLFFTGLYMVCAVYQFKRLRRFVIPAGLLAFALGAGSLFTFSLPSDKGVYAELASAFAHGHTYLARAVPPELLTASDPYQYGYAWKYQIWDLSMYGGHFFTYFGPVPALVRLTLLNLPSEAFMVVFYGFLWALAFYLCCREMAALFGRGKDSLFALAVGAAGGLCPLLVYLLNIHTIYNEAALAASALCGFAFYFFLRAMDGGRRWNYAVSGLCFGLAFATRASLAFAFLPFAILAFISGTERRLAVRNLVYFLVPFAVSGFAMLAYNYVRFGNVAEFGVSYQYNATHALVASGKFFSVKYLLRHLFDYFAVLPTCGFSFPFVRGTGPDGLVYDSSVFSLFVWCPLSVLFAAPLFSIDRNLRHFAWAAFASAMLCLLVVSANAVISARYMMDFAFGFSLCGAATLIAGHTRKPAVFRVLLAALIIFSAYMAVGMTLSAIRIVDPQRYAAWLKLLGLL